jgi:hypothetical protein
MSANAEPVESFEAARRRDRQLLDEMLADVEFLVLRQSYNQAARRFGELRHHVEEHVLTAERLILPRFVERTGDPDGLVQSIREDHHAVAELVDAIATAISRWDRARFIEQLPAMRAALEGFTRPIPIAATSNE